MAAMFRSLQNSRSLSIYRILEIVFILSSDDMNEVPLCTGLGKGPQ